jgi:glycosyltransferase involved in cell wall biosynthesis
LRRKHIRILHIITRLVIGGAQENTILSVAGLRKAGFENTWLASGPQTGPEGSMLDDARRLLGGVLLVPHLVREVSPFKDSAALVEILLLLRRYRPHVVHTHSAKAGILGRIAAWIAGTPFVVHTIHGLPFHRAQSGLLNRLAVIAERLAGVFTDRLIAVSEAMRVQAVVAGLGHRPRLSVVRSGMDVGAFLSSGRLRESTRLGYGLQPDEFVVGVVARLAPLKGHDFVLRLSREVLKRHPLTRFLFVGDGRLRDEIEALTQKLEITDKVVFAGLVHPSEVPALIAATDMVVHASLREGLARVLPQAALCGKPVVTFDVDGADEVVAHAKTGFLTKPGDSSAFLAAMLTLMGNRERAREMGEAGRRKCEGLYSGDKMVERLGKLYMSLSRFSLDPVGPAML